MNSDLKKLRPTSGKLVSSGRNIVISGKSTNGTFRTPNAKPTTTVEDVDIQKLSNQLFQGLQEAFDPHSDIKANDYDLLNGVSPYDMSDNLTNSTQVSLKKSKSEFYGDTEKYKAVAEFAKNRVAKFKEENPKAYMKYKYHKNNNQDAGPFGLTTLNYEGEIYEKPSENPMPDDDSTADNDEDPDDFLKMEAMNYNNKRPGGAADDLEELRRMIRQMDGMLGSYKKQTISLQRSVRDLNDYAGTRGMGVKGDVFDRMDSTLQEIEQIRMSSMKSKPTGFIQSKGSMPTKTTSTGMSKTKPTTSTTTTFSRPPVSGMTRIVMKNKL